MVLGCRQQRALCSCLLLLLLVRPDGLDALISSPSDALDVHDLPVRMHGLRSENNTARSALALGTNLMDHTGRPFAPIEATSNSAALEFAFHVSPLRSPTVRSPSASSTSSPRFDPRPGHGRSDKMSFLVRSDMVTRGAGHLPEPVCLPRDSASV